VGEDFILLASGTPLDVFHDPRSHVWPPVIALSLCDGFISTRVARDQPFVYYSHNLSFDGEVRGNCQFPIFSPAFDFTLGWF